MAMAARMPMIATTIIRSMRVKPRWLPSFRWRLFQNRSMLFLLSFNFLLFVVTRTRLERAFLCDGGREGERGSPGLREADRDQGKRTRFERSDVGVADFAGRRRLGGGKVGDVDEPVENFIAVDLVPVLDSHDTGRVEVDFGQPALQRCEQQQSEEQDCERRLLAANCLTHGWRAQCAAFLPILLPFQFKALWISVLPEGEAKGKATDEDRQLGVWPERKDLIWYRWLNVELDAQASPYPRRRRRRLGSSPDARVFRARGLSRGLRPAWR